MLNELEKVCILDLDTGQFIQKPEWETFVPPGHTSKLVNLNLLLKIGIILEIRKIETK